MVIFNIKLGKKGIAYEGLLPIIVILIIIVIIGGMYFTSFAIKESFQPQDVRLTTEFPSLYVRTFVDSKVDVSEEDRIKFGLAKKDEYRVSDLLVLDDEEAKAKVATLRKEYISWSYSVDVAGNKNMHNFYSELQGISYSQENLLYIEYGTDNDVDLNYVLNNKNSVYAFKDSKGEYTLVYFRYGTVGVN